MDLLRGGCNGIDEVEGEESEGDLEWEVMGTLKVVGRAEEVW